VVEQVAVLGDPHVGQATERNIAEMERRMERFPPLTEAVVEGSMP